MCWQELSGLGDRSKLNVTSVDERYENISITAKTRSIIAFGLSCFKRQRKDPSDNKYSWNFKVHTFNIMVLCSENYIVEPSALKFLVEHGFDFGKQYSKGIPYYRGDDQGQVTNTHDCM